MDPDYIEKEVKVLDVDVAALKKALESLGAEKVFDNDRLITNLDFEDSHLRNNNSTLKITDEGKIKLSLSTPIDDDEAEHIKLVVSRRKEALDLLAHLGVKPISEVTAHRISYEWQGIDFDIDQFPDIPTFMEIDLGQSKITLEELKEKLSIKDKEIVSLSTHEVYNKYSKNYFELYKK